MKNKWLVVVDKKTYLLLLSIPIGLAFVGIRAYQTFTQENPLVMDFVVESGICLLVVLICVIFFVKFNTHSHWMNPDHPKPSDVE